MPLYHLFQLPHPSTPSRSSTIPTLDDHFSYSTRKVKSINSIFHLLLFPTCCYRRQNFLFHPFMCYTNLALLTCSETLLYQLFSPCPISGIFAALYWNISISIQVNDYLAHLRNQKTSMTIITLLDPTFPFRDRLLCNKTLKYLFKCLISNYCFVTYLL